MALISRTMLLAGGLLLSILALCDCTQTPEPSFLVIYPVLITSESEAKLCATVLSPNETLVMSVYVSEGYFLDAKGEKKLLVQETTDKDFHRCLTFQAPSVGENPRKIITVEMKGQTTLWTDRKYVKFRPKPAPITFVQTDKPFYSPGQTVYFRLVTMDTNFIPLSETYNLITLVDSRQNTIGQWHNLTSETKIVQLSYGLTPEAAQGIYTLNVATQHGKKSLTFEVKQYVLPKFEVFAIAPETVCVDAEELTLKMCAKSTFGQPVAGTVSMSLCWKPTWHTPAQPCSLVALEMDATGCASHAFKLALLKVSEAVEGHQHELTFNATVTEEGTGITAADSKNINLDHKLGTLTFIDTPNVIEKGAVLDGKIKFTRYDGTAFAFQTVHLFDNSQRQRFREIQALTTDSDGVAQFSLNTTTVCGDFIVMARGEVDPNLYLHRYYKSAARFVTIQRPETSSLVIDPVRDALPCDTETPITITYTFAGETFNIDFLDIVFVVFAKGEIVQNGVMQVPVSNGQPVIKGKGSLKLSVQPEMAPSVQVLVYCVLPSNKTLMADSREFSTEKCFRNKVSVQFSPPTAVPGERGSLQLSAQPGSLCGLSTVDQSVFILAPGKQQDAHKVFSLLPALESKIDRDVQESHCSWRVDPFGPTAVFERLGLKAITNMAVEETMCTDFVCGHGAYDEFEDEDNDDADEDDSEPQTSAHRAEDCHMYDHPDRRTALYYGMLPAGDDHEEAKKGAAEEEEVDESNDADDEPEAADAESAGATVRTVFPETWLWTLEEVGAPGTTQVPITVPDTITSWETEAFCLHPQGFGLALPVKLTVFQPFFLELSLPYSIILGDTFQLKATVFNYLPKCIMVTVTPAPSSDFSLSPSADGQYSSCLCANGRKTFSWTLVPSTLGLMNITVAAEAASSQTPCGNELVTVPERGRIDTVTRPLLVKSKPTLTPPPPLQPPSPVVPV